MKRLLDYVSWLVLMMAAAACFTTAALLAGFVITLVLLDLDGLVAEVGPAVFLAVLAAIALGVLVMPRGAGPTLADIRAAPDDPDDLLRPAVDVLPAFVYEPRHVQPGPDPGDPLERLWRAAPRLPPHEHRVRPAVPPTQHPEDLPS